MGDERYSQRVGRGLCRKLMGRAWFWGLGVGGLVCMNCYRWFVVLLWNERIVGGAGGGNGFFFGMMLGFEIVEVDERGGVDVTDPPPFLSHSSEKTQMSSHPPERAARKVKLS